MVGVLENNLGRIEGDWAVSRKKGRRGETFLQRKGGKVRA